ncbi:MAG TPA: HAD family hydrolase [Gammaproteobacteria bacterium]|nr:HAD family hydrolase [Gammaproteobacteria bacterium]
MNNISGVLFDLDGTLADTAPDLAYALNETLKLNNKAPLPFEKIRPVVSHGGIALIKLGFGFGPEEEKYESVRQQLLDIYLENIARETRLFPGVSELLAALENKHLPWGIVTNKPGWLTNPLMDKLNLSQRAACIVSGDTVSKNKPHPEPMYYACKQANIVPEKCIYVGDAERDIAAGRAAGMKTVAALFGYLLENDNPSDWQADYTINHPLELLEII